MEYLNSSTPKSIPLYLWSIIVYEPSRGKDVLKCHDEERPKKVIRGRC